jgi:hypothetical protein
VSLGGRRVGHAGWLFVYVGDFAPVAEDGRHVGGQDIYWHSADPLN